MKCEHVKLENGRTVIVCRSRDQRRCKCGNVATKLCDWKTPGRRRPTCDAPLCDSCTFSPATDKDLCAKHKAVLEKHPRNRSPA